LRGKFKGKDDGAVEEDKIRALVREVVMRLTSEGRGEEKAVETQKIRGGMGGVFETISEAIDAAEMAQRDLMALPLEGRNRIIRALRDTGLEHARDFAERTVEETKMGRVEDKIEKFKIVATKTPGTEDLITRSWSGDHGLTIVERAPYGIVGAITPSTHPVPTMLNNAISIVAAGNSAVFNAHPASKKVFAYGLSLFNEAIMNAGGPPNLLTTIYEPTIETGQELFTHPKIRLLLVTGGPAVVKAAMASSKKVIAAGPGNPPVVVDETADIPKAARDIIAGASFDNNIVCIGEKEVFVVESVADQLKREMLTRGCYELSRYQIDQLAKKAFLRTAEGEVVVSRELIGRDASVLAKMIGLDIDPATRLLIGETEFEHSFVQEEQLMPFLPIVRSREVGQAIDYALKAEHGYGHTAVIHSKNIENMSNMARLVNTTIFVKNGPSYAGLGVGGEGYTSFSIASPTGEGLTSAITFTRQRRCALVDYFRII
jgi:acyl-CoA reductase-like NAD-dependent aldehyde dehydrogenase